jgi:hypothetical protein
MPRVPRNLSDHTVLYIIPLLDQNDFYLLTVSTMEAGEGWIAYPSILALAQPCRYHCLVSQNSTSNHGHQYVPWPSRCPILSRLADIESLDPLYQTLCSNIRRNRTSLIPKLVEAHVLRHLCAHETWMYSCDCNTSFFQVQAQQLRAHVQCCFASMVAVVSAALRLVS